MLTHCNWAFEDEAARLLSRTCHLKPDQRTCAIMHWAVNPLHDCNGFVVRSVVRIGFDTCATSAGRSAKSKGPTACTYVVPVCPMVAPGPFKLYLACIAQRAPNFCGKFRAARACAASAQDRKKPRPEKLKRRKGARACTRRTCRWERCVDSRMFVGPGVEIAKKPLCKGLVHEWLSQPEWDAVCTHAKTAS